MEDAGDRVRVHVKIEGRVQGVFFRAATHDQANRLGVKGWVRNYPDGAVELVAEGKRKSIDDLISWCRHGPPGAHVRDVQVQWQEFEDEFSAFRITR